LLGDGKRIINLDAEIADRTFQLRVAKQELDRTQVAREPWCAGLPNSPNLQ
jgi:hypothetical protein